MSGPAPVRSAADPGARLLVEGGDAVLEGVIVDGDREEDRQWDLDSRFVLLTDDGERIRVSGWMCLIEVDEEEEKGGRRVDGGGQGRGGPAASCRGPQGARAKRPALRAPPAPPVPKRLPGCVIER